MTNMKNLSAVQRIRVKKRALKAMEEDVLRGMPRHKVMEKFQNDEYGCYDPNCTPGTNERKFRVYWRDMLKLFAQEFEENREDLKSKFCSRYMYVYELCLKEGKLKEAINALDSLKKMTGVDAPQKVEQDIDLQGEVVIDFGILPENNGEDDVQLDEGQV